MSLYLLDLVHATDLQKLRGTRVDFIILFVVMGYGYIINLQIITTPVLSTINISPFFKLSYLEAVRQEIPSTGHVWSCFLFPGHRCIEIFDPSRVCAGSCRLVSLLQALSIVIHKLCDTPCGFVRHMDCRDPETTGHLWGSFGGCLEEPSLEKMPTKVHY